MKILTGLLLGLVLVTSDEIVQCGAELSDDDKATCQVKITTRIAYDLRYFVRERGWRCIKKHGHLHTAVLDRLVKQL